MSPEESMRTKRSASARDDAIDTSTKVASVVVALGGWALGMYAGFNLLVPLVATALVWLVGRKAFDKPRQPILAPFCVQAGHLVWLMVTAAMTQQWLNPYLIGMIWLALGLTWLVVRPGKMPLCALAVFQLLSLPYDLLQLSHSEIGSTVNKVLLVHVTWHCLALFYMARLYYRMSKPVQARAQETKHT